MGTVASNRNIVSVASGRINILNTNSAYQMHNATFTGSNSVAMNFSPIGFALANRTGTNNGTNYITNTTPINYSLIGGSVDALPATNILLLSSSGSANFLDAQLSYFFAGGNLSANAATLKPLFENYLNSL